MDVAQRHEVVLVLVARHDGEQVRPLARCAEKDLALAILYVFLDIKKDGFRKPEVLHVFRDSDTHFVTELEEMVDGVARIEYYCGMIENLYFLLTELAGRKSFDFDERMFYLFLSHLKM